VIVFLAQTTVDPSGVFTDALSLFSNLGIMEYIVNGMAAVIVIGISGAVLRFLR